VAFIPQPDNAAMLENNAVKFTILATAFLIMLFLIWNGGF
jgi:hypothetical protein